jgi:hypothetical protein
MKYSGLTSLLLILCITDITVAQDSTGLSGTPFQEIKYPDSKSSPYLFEEWYSGTIRTSDEQIHDGIKIRYDLKKDEVEYQLGSALYRLSTGVKEFTIPTGTDLYTFKNGFPSVDGNTDKSFYRVMYDGNTKLLKKYKSQITQEKASATREMDPDAKIYILKDDKLSLVKLSDKKSFLKLLPDEKNKMLYVIKEQQLDFAAEDDLISLLQEYDSYKAGRGGN